MGELNKIIFHKISTLKIQLHAEILIRINNNTKYL